MILIAVLAVLTIVAFGILAILMGVGAHRERGDYYRGDKELKR